MSHKQSSLHSSSAIDNKIGLNRKQNSFIGTNYLHNKVLELYFHYFFLGVLQKHKWENAMTIDKESWGFRRNAPLADYFTLKELVKELVITVSTGGNLLMNIGPTKDGIIPPIFEERLRDMGD